MPQALMGQGNWGKVKGRDAYVLLFHLMFLLACISSIGVVDRAFSADTVRLRFEPRPSQYVKTPLLLISLLPKIERVLGFVHQFLRKPDLKKTNSTSESKFKS